MKNGNGFLTMFAMTEAPPQPSPKGREFSPSFGGGWGEVPLSKPTFQVFKTWKVYNKIVIKLTKK